MVFLYNRYAVTSALILFLLFYLFICFFIFISFQEQAELGYRLGVVKNKYSITVITYCSLICTLSNRNCIFKLLLKTCMHENTKGEFENLDCKNCVYSIIVMHFYILQNALKNIHWIKKNEFTFNSHCQTLHFWQNSIFVKF